MFINTMKKYNQIVDIVNTKIALILVRTLTKTSLILSIQISIIY